MNAATPDSAPDNLPHHVPPLPFGVSFESPLAAKEDWQLVVEMLPPRDPEADFYLLRDLIDHLGNVSTNGLSRHAADLWPDFDGNYRIKFSQVVALVKRYCRVGRHKHTRAELERRWRARFEPVQSATSASP